MTLLAITLSLSSLMLTYVTLYGAFHLSTEIALIFTEAHLLLALSMFGIILISQFITYGNKIWFLSPTIAISASAMECCSDNNVIILKNTEIYVFPEGNVLTPTTDLRLTVKELPTFSRHAIPNMFPMVAMAALYSEIKSLGQGAFDLKGKVELK